jgi:1,5-anhydro-D-fructose reductase (1,5-anhydro-D-mannitol-forming)
MSDTLGWAIVGLGRIAETQIAPAIGAAPNSTLVHVVGRDQERTAEFAARHGATHAGSDYPRALADPEVGAVYIATPNALHAQQVIAAAQAGKHVLCDKPLGLTVADAERAAGACAEAGVRLGVMFQTREHEGMRRVRALLTSGAIGDVVVAQIEMSAGRTGLAGWRVDPALAGAGSVTNIGVHGYDLLRYLLGSEVCQVGAMLDPQPDRALETTALVILRMRSGTLAYVNANQSVPQHRADLVLYGTTGRITGQNVTRPDRQGTITVTTQGDTEEFAVSSTGAYAKTLSDFATAVLAGTQPSPTGADGLASVRIVDAIGRSAREGRIITL